MQECENWALFQIPLFRDLPQNVYAKLEEITCRVDCEGLYADVVYDNAANEEDTLVLENLIQDYNAFKYKYVPNLVLTKGYGIGINTYTYRVVFLTGPPVNLLSVGR